MCRAENTKKKKREKEKKERENMLSGA